MHLTALTVWKTMKTQGDLFMKTQQKDRSLYWDIVKGWGIIAIVLGHTGYFAGAFVYLFHLALFFFITGYFYNEKKYGDAPFIYFGSRLAGAWPRYMFYTLFFVLLHNFFVTHGLYNGQEVYNHTKMLTAWMSSLSFNSPEQIQGALWFVPVWLVSSGLFAGCIWFGRKVSRLSDGSNTVKLTACAASSIMIGLIGLFLNMRSCSLPYNLHTALLVVPLYLIAWFMQLFLTDFRRYTVWYGCLVSAILLHLINTKLHIFIDLASMHIPGILFYPVSVIGIYFVLSLSDLSERINILAKIIAFLGRHSFDIMAVHFTVFKLLDFAYARFILKNIPETLSSFPVAFRYELGPFYILIGLFLPALIGWCVDRVTAYLK